MQDEIDIEEIVHRIELPDGVVTARHLAIRLRQPQNDFLARFEAEAVKSPLLNLTRRMRGATSKASVT